jgi:hypothetical protein
MRTSPDYQREPGARSGGAARATTAAAATGRAVVDPDGNVIQLRLTDRLTDCPAVSRVPRRTKPGVLAVRLDPRERPLSPNTRRLVVTALDDH